MIKNNVQLNPEDYVTLMQIGQGNFSELYLVEHKTTKVLYTLKMFTKLRVEQLKKQTDVLMEKHVMNKIEEHENIIKFYGSNKDEMYLYILYEYVNGGELWKKCVIYGLASENLVKYYFLQILDGVSHMHKHNIVHRDLKPENIMVTKDELVIKLIDFGSCKDMEGTEFEKKFEEERVKLNSRKPSYKNFVGTPNYMAPECVRNKDSDFKCDVWSLGCVLFHLFTGFPPFLGKSDYLIFLKSTEANFTYPNDIIPPLAQDLISKMIVVDPSKRLTIQEIYDHPFLSESNSIRRYPYLTLGECSYKTILKTIRNKFLKYKETSEKLDKIKKYEMMQDEISNVKEGEEDLYKEEKKLILEKDNLNAEFKIGLSNLVNELNQITDKIINSPLVNSEKLINKFTHLEKQLKHEIFKIDYEENSI